MIELKVKATVNTGDEIEKCVKAVEQVQKEHNCVCTLLEIHITPVVEYK